MKTVVVVDDEKVILDGITHLVEATPGFRVLARYRNGRDALSGCRRLQPDIIITDVKMPVSDGLTLVEEGQKYLRAQYIVISGYEEFEYARRAAVLHVSEYLLKPVDIQQLRNALTTVSARIDTMKAEQTLSRRQLAMICLQPGRASSGLAAALMVRLQLRVEAVTCAALFLHRTPRPTEAMLEEACAALDAGCAERGLRDYAVCVQGRHIFLFLFAADPGGALLRELAAHIRRCVYAQLGCKSYAGLSREFPALEHAAQAAAQAAVAAHAFLYGSGEAVFQFSAGWDYGEEPESYIRAPRQQLVALAEAHDMEQSKAYIRAFLRLCVENDYSPELFFRFLRTAAEQCARSLNLKGHQRADLERLVESLYYAEVDLNGFLRGLDHFAAELVQNQNAGGTALVEKVIDYAEIHYRERLSLSDISGMFYVNGSHFCKVFKRKTGLTFNEYLARLRIRKAKQFIRSGSYKIYEISGLCGFRDPKYFAQIFRKLTGQSPSQYAAQCGTGERIVRDKNEGG